MKAVPIAKAAGQPFENATAENAVKGAYPLSRFLYVYVNKKPNQPLSPLEREFIRLVLSKQGQEAVVKDGFIPLPAAVAARALKDAGIE